MRRLLACFIVALALGGGIAWGCFGPKLYVGTGAGVEAEVLYELVALYLKEKTGIETVRVELEGRDAAEELHGERLDLAFAPGPAPGLTPLIELAGLPLLLSGRRPLEDIQFTTAGPALRRLGSKLTPLQVRDLCARVAAGAPVKAEVRRFLTEARWL